MTWTRYAISGVNPEPWTSPDVAVAKAKNGKPYPVVHKAAALTVYQEAIKGALRMGYPDVVAKPVNVELELLFCLWRQLPTYEGGRAGKVTKHIADATNMQKALEDALQGVLFDNDRQVTHVETWVIEQSTTTEPLILVYLRPVEERPPYALEAAKEFAGRGAVLNENLHAIPEGVF